MAVNATPAVNATATFSNALVPQLYAGDISVENFWFSGETLPIAIRASAKVQVSAAIFTKRKHGVPFRTANYYCSAICGNFEWCCGDFTMFDFLSQQRVIVLHYCQHTGKWHGLASLFAKFDPMWPFMFGES